MNDHRLPLDGKAVALVVLCCVIWGLGQVVVKLTLPEIPPMLQAAVRSAGAAALLLAWSAWRGVRVLARDGTWAGGLLAGLLFAAEFGCIFVGLQYTTASRMSVFIYLAPFVVAVGMPLIARNERLSPLQWLGMAAAFAGVVWAFAEGFVDAPSAGPKQWVGDALGLAAALLWGATTLALRATKLSRAPAETALLWQLGVSALALGAAAWAAGEVVPTTLSGQALALMAVQTVVISFASFLVWFWLLRHYVATRISVYTLLTPVFGLLAGVLLLSEPLTLRLLVALLAVCAGIALVNRPGRAARTAAAPHSKETPS